MYYFPLLQWCFVHVTNVQVQVCEFSQQVHWLKFGIWHVELRYKIYIIKM